ncbi:hypothetical protein PV325_005261 [Microctonus aethiopoides]|nr:hypothetical protein PV325_005261 [Microctonus aethiopoides]
MLTMSTLMMPTTITTITNPGPIPTHTVPPKIEQTKLSTAASLNHAAAAANKSERESTADDDDDDDDDETEWAMDGFGFSFAFLTRLPKFRPQIQF